MNGKIINISRFCTDDGPGIRTVIFLKGCPLSCIWCHNPESQCIDNEIIYNSEKCCFCNKCKDVCLEKCHEFKDDIHTFNKSKCIKCGKCACVCPANALEVSGRDLSANEAFEEIKKDFVFYQTSGGGATISGGEPLIQPEFTCEILRLCRENNIHTSIETSGFASEGALRAVLKYCSLVLFDIKETDESKHLKFTGVSLKPILHNLHIINDMNIPIILRVPVIPGLNDYEQHFLKVKQLFSQLKSCLKVQIMPYHDLGKYKYTLLQRPYLCDHIEAPDNNTVREWTEKIT